MEEKYAAGDGDGDGDDSRWVIEAARAAFDLMSMSQKQRGAGAKVDAKKTEIAIKTGTGIVCTSNVDFTLMQGDDEAVHGRLGFIVTGLGINH